MTALETITALRHEPGIDLRLLKPGTIVFLETNLCQYELKVLNPDNCLIEISGTDEGLKQPTIGQFTASIYPLDPLVRLEGWIGRNLVMEIRFRNGNYVSGPIISAGLKGKGWDYEVFTGVPDIAS
jgi:hypothetical protein